jgi:hypothetical protein
MTRRYGLPYSASTCSLVPFRLHYSRRKIQWPSFQCPSCPPFSRTSPRGARGDRGLGVSIFPVRLLRRTSSSPVRAQQRKLRKLRGHMTASRFVADTGRCCGGAVCGWGRLGVTGLGGQIFGIFRCCVWS